jgi:hypothetical protein
MSLDFELSIEIPEKTLTCQCGRENTIMRNEIVFRRNITHNLAKMASKAGLYNCLWRPLENGFLFANQILGPLENGIHNLLAEPLNYQGFNPQNGWGIYDNLLEFSRVLLKVCKEYPQAKIMISR